MKKQWKKALSIMLALSIITGLLTGVCTTASADALPFSDVGGEEWKWALDALTKLKNAGLISGNMDGTFNPGGNLTRAELAAVLTRAFKLKLDPNAPSSFSDIGGVPWAKQHIEAAKKYFIYSGDEFRPNNNATRQEIAYAFVKAMGFDTGSVSTAEAQAKYSKDWTSIDDAYKPSVALATKLGLISGDGNGRFNPTLGIKRAEMAVLMYRVVKFDGGAGGGKFSDVKPGDWYYKAVMNLANRGLVNGFEDGTFKPDEELKNNELPVLTARLLGKDTSGGYDPMTDGDVTSKLPGNFTSNDSSLTREVAAINLAKMLNLAPHADPDTVLSRFTDQGQIPSVAYAVYKPEIASVVDAAYMKGFYNAGGELIFDPTGSVTRAEISVLMVNVLPADAKKPGQVFSDVPPTHWTYDGVMNLYNRGIVNGYPDGTFKPDDQLAAIGVQELVRRHLKKAGQNADDINSQAVLDCFPGGIPGDTREIAAYAVVRALGFDTTQVNAEDILKRFVDKDQISAECKPALAYLVSLGVLKGSMDEEGNISMLPNEKITRGQFAVFYAKVLNGVDKSKMYDYEKIIEAVKQEGGE